MMLAWPTRPSASVAVASRLGPAQCARDEAGLALGVQGDRLTADGELEHRDVGQALRGRVDLHALAGYGREAGRQRDDHGGGCRRQGLTDQDGLARDQLAVADRERDEVIALLAGAGCPAHRAGAGGERHASRQVLAGIGQGRAGVGVNALEREGQQLADGGRVVGHLQGRRPVNLVDVDRDVGGVAESVGVLHLEVQDVVARLAIGGRPLDQAGEWIDMGARRQGSGRAERERVSLGVGGRERELEWGSLALGLRRRVDEDRRQLGGRDRDLDRLRAGQAPVAGRQHDARERGPAHRQVGREPQQARPRVERGVRRQVGRGYRRSRRRPGPPPRAGA